MRACYCVGVAIMQDYTEEFRDITKGSKSKEALPAGSITLINQRPVGEDLHVNFFISITKSLPPPPPPPFFPPLIINLSRKSFSGFLVYFSFFSFNIIRIYEISTDY